MIEYTDQERIEAVAEVLRQSDIVWSKYGTDTREALAERILAALGLGAARGAGWVDRAERAELPVKVYR